MLKFPTMEHDEPYMAHVPPGKTGAIIWTFSKAGEFDFACLIAGHYQAGMVGKINVANRAQQPGQNTTAQAPARQAQANQTPAEQAPAEQVPMTQGEIMKVDKDTGKVTIKHGAIKNLDMPAMTMVFRVKDAAMLDQVKAGDRIEFSSDKVNGNFTVTKVDVAK